MYTNEFIEGMGDRFYHDDYKPYAYDIKNIVYSKPETCEGEIVAFVQVDDRAGRYFQHIFFIKKEDRYYISDIMNDI